MPGDTFKYADVNYLLASEIIEQITKKPFYTSIAELLEFDKYHLNATWFVTLQKPSKKTKPLVHQYYQKYPWDSYELNPSWDLYGGGGMASTTKDLATFFQLLFEGKIIKDTSLLKKMCSPIYSKTNYCLGIRKMDLNGITGYYHGGWWGTDAIYFPESKISIAIYILERSEKDISRPLLESVLKIILQI
jgi:D-alanyl-D-alanine carboxypeptidase